MASDDKAFVIFLLMVCGVTATSMTASTIPFVLALVAAIAIAFAPTPGGAP